MQAKSNRLKQTKSNRLHCLRIKVSIPKKKRKKEEEKKERERFNQNHGKRELNKGTQN